MKLTARKTALTIAELAVEKRAEDIIILDLRKITPVTDFFVLCSGTTDIQVRAISDSIQMGLKKKKILPWHTEGSGYFQWVLLDFVDVVAHIFQPETRTFYSLERLWGDAKRIPFIDPAERKTT